MTQPVRRVAGKHSIRLDGLLDIEARARGASVLDLGCNRGLVGYGMYLNGATVVHGCDVATECIHICRHLFADLRDVESKFETVDLTGGPSALQTAFGARKYDIVLMLATYHKLKRIMPAETLSALMQNLGQRTAKYFVWRGTSYQHDDNEDEVKVIDRDLGMVGLKRIHTSYISDELGVAAIWGRP
jgi:hypothetical protein